MGAALAPSILLLAVWASNRKKRIRHDKHAYKGRNVIERGFNLTKQRRGLATRYDKLAIVYRGAAVLRAITIWLTHLPDTPQFGPQRNVFGSNDFEQMMNRRQGVTCADCHKDVVAVNGPHMRLCGFCGRPG